jgi:hypothetical protein
MGGCGVAGAVQAWRALRGLPVPAA